MLFTALDGGGGGGGVGVSFLGTAIITGGGERGSGGDLMVMDSCLSISEDSNFATTPEDEGL